MRRIPTSYLVKSKILTFTVVPGSPARPMIHDGGLFPSCVFQEDRAPSVMPLALASLCLLALLSLEECMIFQFRAVLYAT